MIHRIVSGKTKNTDWKQHFSTAGLPIAVYVSVDTTAAGFVDTPVYIPTLEGDKDTAETTGGDVVYAATKTGFKVFVRLARGGNLTPDNARDNNWYITWKVAQSVPIKGLYVDGLYKGGILPEKKDNEIQYGAAILGNEAEENLLLNYAKKKGFNYFIFYEIHSLFTRLSKEDEKKNESLPAGQKILHSAAYADDVKNKLATFIKKAKTEYGILQVAAVGENSRFFRERIETYNDSRPDQSERIDVCNVEFEYWIDDSTKPGSVEMVVKDGKQELVEKDQGVLCTYYLSNKSWAIGKAERIADCNRSGGFAYYKRLLYDVQTMVKRSKYTMFAETYVGFFKSGEALGISDPMDINDSIRNASNPIGRILIADYTELELLYPNIKERLSFFENSPAPLNVLPIFSAEEGEGSAKFLGQYLKDGGTVEEPYQKIISGLVHETGMWKMKINLGGYVWFTYSILREMSP